jgi:hypothetical protein
MISGTVYKLLDKRVPEEVLYVGSTVQSLKTRWIRHKHDSKSPQSKLYTHLRDQGVEHFELVSLEREMFKDKDALREREEEYRVKLKPTLNTIKCFTGLAGLGLTEAEYQKQYRAANKDEIRATKKQYYAKNKDELNKRASEPLTCDVCGSSKTRSHKAEHERTKKHAAAVVAPFVRARFGRAAFLAKRFQA